MSSATFIARLLGNAFGPRIRCDSCDMRFEANLQDTPTEDGGLFRHFDCPRCDTRYPVARITPRGVELMSRIQSTTTRGNVARLQRELRGEVHRP